jgi:hypothetical protein
MLPVPSDRATATPLHSVHPDGRVAPDHMAINPTGVPLFRFSTVAVRGAFIVGKVAFRVDLMSLR